MPRGRDTGGHLMSLAGVASITRQACAVVSSRPLSSLRAPHPAGPPPPAVCVSLGRAEASFTPMFPNLRRGGREE